MTYSMKLDNDSFVAMKYGYKTIEMRLNDEKRSLIQKGDYIEFTNTSTDEKMMAKVKSINAYKSFDELYSHYDKILLGYAKDECASPDDMLKYYDEEKIRKYGVIAIEVMVYRELD